MSIARLTASLYVNLPTHSHPLSCQCLIALKVPSPDTKQVNDTTACVAKCPQGDGSKAQTETYRKCTDKCIADNYYVSSVGTPQPTGGAGSGGNGGSKGGNGGDDESASGTATGSADATKSGTASPSSSDNAAGTLVGSSATLFGLFAAMLAL